MKPADFPPVEGIPDFWRRLREAPRAFLALDYDGTVAPFRVDRLEARPLPRIPEILSSLERSRAAKVAVISGRPLGELRRLLGDLPVTMVGSHGFEMKSAEGRVSGRAVSKAQRAGMEEARTFAQGRGLGGRLEAKVSSCALHTRGLPREEAARLEDLCRRAWSSIALDSDLECMRFDGGVEVRCKGWNKGDVLDFLLRREPRETLPVYIGDDRTDEDAFRRIRCRGLGIRVGAAGAPTAARGSVPGCGAVRDLLQAWLDCRRDRPGRTASGPSG